MVISQAPTVWLQITHPQGHGVRELLAGYQQAVGVIETCALGVPPGRPTTSECTMSVQLSEAFLRASTTSYSSVSIMYTLVNGIPLAVEMSGNLEILS
jgi:hypothetical protein